MIEPSGIQQNPPPTFFKTMANHPKGSELFQRILSRMTQSTTNDACLKLPQGKSRSRQEEDGIYRYKMRRPIAGGQYDLRLTGPELVGRVGVQPGQHIRQVVLGPEV